MKDLRDLKDLNSIRDLKKASQQARAVRREDRPPPRAQRHALQLPEAMQFSKSHRIHVHLFD